MYEYEHSLPRLVGLLMAPPVGGGEKGGLVERPVHPKPPGGAPAAPWPGRRQWLDDDMLLEGDGNWDDGNVQEQMGFKQGAETQIGGIVDMEDDVYLEFEEEEEDEVWGKRYGKGLGEAIEVDVPASEQEKEFLRVRVRLPYNRRLQTHITTGVKGRPGEVKVFKLKYERVPYYCSHCGFMGHKKDECEKKRLGVASLNYGAHELRCSPYKKYEYRTFHVPPAGHASTKRALSFASFGSAESHKSSRPYASQRQNSSTQQVGSRSDSSGKQMPPLEDDIVPGRMTEPGCIGMLDEFGGVEMQVPNEVEAHLAAEVEAMQMRMGQEGRVQEVLEGRDASQPIIQFPEDEPKPTEVHGADNVHITMTADMLMRMQQMQAKAASSSSGGRSLSSNEMIPAMRNLSNLQVSFGSASDTLMPPADSVLGKRGAEEANVQGERLDLSLGLNYGSKDDGGMQKKGKKQAMAQDPAAVRSMEVVYKRNKKQTATGHVPSGKLARPNMWSRQGQ
ncbi:hypothetical protein ACQ4PT_028441 [Festuca glaucescens]